LEAHLARHLRAPRSFFYPAFAGGFYRDARVAQRFFLVRFVVGGEPAAPPDLDGALAADGRKSMSRAPRPAFTQLPGRKP